MRLIHRFGAASIAAIIGFGAAAAFAQVPQHPPGTICFTPRFWCWAGRPGAPGALCSCPSPYGPVAGKLG